jgi:hypothetical protein
MRLTPLLRFTLGIPLTLCLAAMLGEGVGPRPAWGQGEELFVVSLADYSVRAFDPRGNGNVSPVRILSGAATGLNAPMGVAFAGPELFVVNNNSITVYSRTASGNTPPLRTISGPATD